MLTRQINFFGKTLKVNVSSVIPIKYNFEFQKDINSLLKKLMDFASENKGFFKNKKNLGKENFDFEKIDFELFSDCIELGYVMLKYADNEDFNYESFEDYLSNFEFIELSSKSMEIVSEYIGGTRPTFQPRVKVKKKKGKRGR